MNALFDTLDWISAGWAAGMLRASGQGALALMLAWGCRALPGIPPRAQCWIWRLAYVKLLIALVWGTPIELPLLPPGPESVAVRNLVTRCRQRRTSRPNVSPCRMSGSK
jgi:hypothetical protein